MKEPRPLSEIRADIDRIDADLIRLLNERAKLALEVGQIKGRDGKPYFTPEREREIFERIRLTNPGPLEPSQLVSIFREVISAARAAEKPLTSAYWGPAGSHSHAAALEAFGASSNFIPVGSIAEVFEAVEQGRADYGVVPVENSVAGAVPETFDCLGQTTLKICAELYAPIHHHLLSRAAKISEVKRVYTGPQPFQQCQKWLRRNLPAADIVECAPTSRAAEHALEDTEGGAIASRLAAETLGLPILVENIHDLASNR